MFLAYFFLFRFFAHKELSVLNQEMNLTLRFVLQDGFTLYWRFLWFC